MVAIAEVATELGGQGLENVADPNIGGTVEFSGGWVRLTPAWHTGTTPNGTVHTPAGLVINLGGKTVYHVGDTALFSDIRLAASATSSTRRSSPSAATTWTARTRPSPASGSPRPS